MPYEKYVIEKFQVGLIDENELSKLSHPPGASIDCQNVIWMPSGALTKRKGLRKLNAVGPLVDSAIVHMQQMKDKNGSDYVVAFSCASGSTSASIGRFDDSSGIGTFHPIYVDGWLVGDGHPVSTTTFMGSGAWTSWSNVGPIYGWDAAAATPSAAVPITDTPSGAKVVVAFGNFLFLCNMLGDTGAEAGVQQRSRIRWSAARDWTDWPVTYYMDLDTDDGDEIKAATMFRNSLIIFKEFKMYAIRWVGGTELFRAERIDDSVGCVGPNAWVESGGDLYFLGCQVPYKYTGQGVPESIGDAVQSTFDEMDLTISQMNDVDSDEEFYEVMFNMATSDSEAARKDTQLVYDTRFGSWTRFDMTASCIRGIDYGTNAMYITLTQPYSAYAGTQIRDWAGAKEGMLAVGSYSGDIREYGLSNNDDGVAIEGYWKSRWIDFGDPTVNKRLYRVTFFVEKELGDYDFTFELYTDWDQDNPVLTKLVSLTGATEETVLEQKIDFTKPCRSAQFKFYTNELISPFTIHKVIIEYLVRGRTKT